MRFPSLLLACASLALVSCATTPLAPVAPIASVTPVSPLDTLIAQHVAARGGAAAIEAMKGVEIDLTIVEKTFTVSGPYLANRDGCMRIDIYADGKYALSEGVSKDGGWSARAGDTQTKPQPPEGARTLLHGIENPLRLIGLHEFPRRGHRLVYAGQETIDGILFDKIVANYSDGYYSEFFLDPKTHLIARQRERKAFHFESDPTKQNIETRFSDYRAVGGVQFPFRSQEVDWTTGDVLSTTTVKSIKLNSPAALNVCQPPALPIG